MNSRLFEFSKNRIKGAKAIAEPRKIEIAKVFFLPYLRDTTLAIHGAQTTLITKAKVNKANYFESKP